MVDWRRILSWFRPDPRKGRTVGTPQVSAVSRLREKGIITGPPAPADRQVEPVAGQTTDEFFISLNEEQKTYFREEEPSGFTLRILEGPMAGYLLPLIGTHITVGRSAVNDVPLDDAMVSEHHLQLVIERGCPPMLEDLGSTNGTRLNDQLAKSAPLQPGDRIQLGKTCLEFVKDSV